LSITLTITSPTLSSSSQYGQLAAPDSNNRVSVTGTYTGSATILKGWLKMDAFAPAYCPVFSSSMSSGNWGALFSLPSGQTQWPSGGIGTLTVYASDASSTADVTLAMVVQMPAFLTPRASP
jgi:hypothetical protein